MDNFTQYQEQVIGKTLTNLFFTEQNGPHDYMPGVSPAYYFSTIIELDHKTQLLFSNDYMGEWNNSEPLITLTPENWELPTGLVFKGQIIRNLTRDEYGNMTFHLHNGVTIAHTVDYGDQLLIENGEATNTNAPQHFLLKPKRKWWQKLFLG